MRTVHWVTRLGHVRLLATVCCLAAAASAVFGTASKAEDADNVFRGKTINFYVGFAPNGSYDFYARLLAPYLTKHIPGAPSVVVQTMTGAGSLQAANFLYSIAPKDGTAIGTVTQTLALEEALHSPGARYKAAQFNWIGRMSATLQVGVTSDKARAKNIEDAKRIDVPFAGTGAGSPSEGYPRMLDALAGTRFKIVSGYASSPEAMLAMESGEVDGAQTSWDTLKRTKQDWLSANKLNILYQCALERSPELPNVPTTVELGTTEEARSVLKFYTQSAAVGLPILAPPGVPADRVKILRTAFDEIMRDPELLAELSRRKVEFTPASGVAIQKIIEDTTNTPQPIIDRAQAILRNP